MRVLQTSSSHEPFDVPYHRLGNKVLNALHTQTTVWGILSHFKEERTMEELVGDTSS